MSKPIPEQSNFIAIGAWNPAIIQPHWLKKEFPTQIPSEFKVQVVTGVISSLRIEFEKEFIIDPNGGRLVFIPYSLDDKCLKKIADLAEGIQDKLSHTPIAAAGCNFVFKLDDTEIFKLEEYESEEDIEKIYKKLGDDSLVSRSINHTLSQEDFTINLTYEFKKNSRHLRVNFDYQHPIFAMKTAAGAFVNNYHRALEICNEVTEGQK